MPLMELVSDGNEEYLLFELFDDFFEWEAILR